MSNIISLDQGTWQNNFVLHPKSAEPIGRLASNSQYIYLQISTGTPLLCTYSDCPRGSFYFSFYRRKQANGPDCSSCLNKYSVDHALEINRPFLLNHHSLW